MKLKKPKFWDFKKPNYLSDLLLPLSKLIEIHSGIKRMKKKGLKGSKQYVLEIYTWVEQAKHLLQLN